MTTPGIDTFLEGRGHRDEGLALVTNPSAVCADGRPTWEALLEGGWKIRAFFGPEHGFRGDAQDGEKVEDREFRGIPAWSLYGSRREPEPSMLAGIDRIVFDIQDLGSRYYTYLYTLANMLKAARAADLPLTVLDRPNPLGGLRVEGLPMPEEHASFVGAYGLPPRYGMTIGEFARWLAGRYFPGVRLEVVPLAGWRRGMLFAETGLPWATPSPNMPGIAPALLYPGTCLVEGTNLSEGRGTTRPFETIGAPWLDGPAYRARLAALGLPGVIPVPAAFTPAFGKHAGAFCGGVHLCVAEPAALRPFRAGIAAIMTARELDPARFAWREMEGRPGEYWIDRLAGGPGLRALVDGGASIEEVTAAMTAGEEDFLAAREPYLIYP